MSSGNLTADRRFAYAQMLRRDGDAEAAADVIAQALELAPAWPEGRFALAETLAEAGRKYDAMAAYEAYLLLDPADSMGASIKLALLGAGVPPAMPEAYIKRLFDEYAPRFDKALVEKLNYRAPEILRAALERVQPDSVFARVFDLGCGTGLAGVALRPRATWLGGVDLSPVMIKHAGRKALYDFLIAGDMVAALNDLETPCDLIVAADVLTYVGDLTTVFEATRQRLISGGFFAFTVQHDEGTSFSLGTEHRFNHGRGYIEKLATQTGFQIKILENAVSRQEKGVDVPGLVAVLQTAPMPTA
jgi:predicted TPR repeat methyltransferase